MRSSFKGTGVHHNNYSIKSRISAGLITAQYKVPNKIKVGIQPDARENSTILGFDYIQEYITKK